MRVAWRAVWQIRLDKIVLKYSQREKLSIFLFLAFIFSNQKEKQAQKMERSLYFNEKNSPRFLFFEIFF